MNVMTKLINGIQNLKSPIVAGIDTTIEMIPESMKNKYFDEYGNNVTAVSNMILDYNKIIIDNIYDLIPAVKIQIAMYEKYGISGLNTYNETSLYAASKGLLVMGDIKRGDIGSTAEAYSSHLCGTNINENNVPVWHEDMITINPYLGNDSLTPFVKACKETGKACFILVKTSNPGSRDIQDLIIKDKEQPLYEIVGEMVSNAGSDNINACGYSQVGAVVGATHKEIGRTLRKKMPHTFFLVPGYGAQGATASDIGDFFDKNGRGAIVNSSRGIITNWQKDNKYNEKNIGDAAREATLTMKEDLNKYI